MEFLNGIYKKEVTEGSAVRYCAPPDFFAEQGKT